MTIGALILVVALVVTYILFTVHKRNSDDNSSIENSENVQADRESMFGYVTYGDEKVKIYSLESLLNTRFVVGTYFADESKKIYQVTEFIERADALNHLVALCVDDEQYYILTENGMELYEGSAPDNDALIHEASISLYDNTPFEFTGLSGVKYTLGTADVAEDADYLSLSPTTNKGNSIGVEMRVGTSVTGTLQNKNEIAALTLLGESFDASENYQISYVNNTAVPCTYQDESSAGLTWRKSWTDDSNAPDEVTVFVRAYDLSQYTILDIFEIIITPNEEGLYGISDVVLVDDYADTTNEVLKAARVRMTEIALSGFGQGDFDVENVYIEILDGTVGKSVCAPVHYGNSIAYPESNVYPMFAIHVKSKVSGYPALTLYVMNGTGNNFEYIGYTVFDATNASYARKNIS